MPDPAVPPPSSPMPPAPLAYQSASHVPPDWTNVRILAYPPAAIGQAERELIIGRVGQAVAGVCVLVALRFVLNATWATIGVGGVVVAVALGVQSALQIRQLRARWPRYRLVLADQGIVSVSTQRVLSLPWADCRKARLHAHRLCLTHRNGGLVVVLSSLQHYDDLCAAVRGNAPLRHGMTHATALVLMAAVMAVATAPAAAIPLVHARYLKLGCLGLFVAILAIANVRAWRLRTLAPWARGLLAATSLTLALLVAALVYLTWR